MTNRADTGIQTVLHAAMTLVAAHGVRGLSLRPLAEQLDTTVSALSHRFGLKDALLASLIDAAREADSIFFGSWFARIREIEVRDGALLADFADTILSEMVGREALRTQFYCELVQSSASRPEVDALFAPWREQRLTFWRAASEGLDRAELGDMLHAFSTDESAYGLAIGDLGAYRWLRRLNLHRLCCGLAATADGADMRRFAMLHAALGELPGPPVRLEASAMSEWQAKAAPHIAALIITEGADAVTHRAAAARAGVANSTLAYHFPRQEDLLKAGLSDIIARLGVFMNTPSPAPDVQSYEMTTVEIARATYAVALATTRMPDLRAIAADMRRRRGENLLIRFNRQVTGISPFDLLSAQAISITGIGKLMLDAELDPAPDAAAFQLAERMAAGVMAAA
jgi:DNA-binding transcriptional regulator YbjK